MINKTLKARIIEKFGTQAAFARALYESEAVVSHVVRGYRTLSPAEEKKWEKLLSGKRGSIKKPFTVILDRSENNGDDYYFAHVEAKDITRAIDTARVEVIQEDHCCNCIEEDCAVKCKIDPERYALVAIFEGNHMDART